MSTTHSLSQQEHLFLELLASAIHGDIPDPTPFVGLDDAVWTQIHRLMVAHAVPAFVGDRVLLLPKEALPCRTLRLTIFSEIEMTKRGNRYLTKALEQLSALYQAHDLPFVLLKGLGLSLFYPDPTLRTGGDLDTLFYRSGDYERANALLEAEGYYLHDDSEVRYGHTAFTYGRTVVENHARAVFFDHKKYNQFFDDLVWEAAQSDAFLTITYEGYTFKTLPHELNIVYTFIHMFFHWLHWGVGFRQYCDWIRLMTQLKGQVDTEEIERIAGALDILYPMQLFAQAAEEYLRVAPEVFPFSRLEGHDPYSDQIVRDVLRSGNFGFSQRPERARSRLMTDLRKLLFKARRSYRLHAIAPTHASRIIWGSIIGHLMLRLRKL